MTVESSRHMRTPTGYGSSPRFNPFDDLSTSTELDDDTLAPSSASELTSETSEGSGDISLAELGLTEDYFARPEGRLFGMSSAEELEAAIENCKKMILEAREHSDRQKKLVNKLIQLRMKFQELKEGPSEIEPKVKQVLGHKLRKKKSNSIKYYCDCCNGLIWGMMQAWYRCKDCGFNCHYKCVNMIRRKCIAADLKNLPYILKIAPEIGLSSQQFNCFECKNPISVTAIGKEEARLCDYSGQYYCPQCHWNDTSVIPARVLHNWDFSPQKVSRQSLQILSRLHQKPLLNVQEVNPLLFNFVDELRDVRKLRQDILLMKEYFVTCNSALELKLLLKLSVRQHFVDNASMYSLEDLVMTQERVLSDDLTRLHAEYAQHIKLDCPSCQAKGFICEICNAGETLFPFDSRVSTCSKCKAVFHQDCFTLIDCPRCERFQKKREQRTAIITEKLKSESEETESDTDYLHGKNTSSQDSSSSAAEDSKKIVENFTPAFSTEPPRVTQNLSQSSARERTPSSTIKIENSMKKPHDTSLHNLLSESSYTDYAVLGFTGAGKSRQSVPNLQSFLNEHPTTKVQKTEKPAEVESIVTSQKILQEHSGYQRKQKSRVHFDRSRSDEERFQSNPITRRRQRDEALFGDLVEVKGQSSEMKNEHRSSLREIIHYSEGVSNSSRSSRGPQGRTTQPNLEDPFNVNVSKGSKFMTEAARAPENLTSDLHSDPFNLNQNNRSKFMTPELKPNKQKKGTKLTTGKVGQRLSRTNVPSGSSYDPNLDPFNQDQTSGSRFINDAASSALRSKQGAKLSPNVTYDLSLDPFSLDAGPSKVTPRFSTPNNSYNPNLDPFNQHEPPGSKFMSDVTSSRKTTSKYFDADKGNPFGEENSGNPFEDNQQDSKNPFRMN